MQGTLIAHSGAIKLSRDELRHLPFPESTGTFKPVAHAEIVDALIDTLGFRHIAVVRDEYAATADGMKTAAGPSAARRDHLSVCHSA